MSEARDWRPSWTMYSKTDEGFIIQTLVTFQDEVTWNLRAELL